MVLCDSIPVVNRGSTISTTPLPSEILGAAPLNCRFTTGSNMAFSDSFGNPSKFQGILIMFLGDCHIFGAAKHFWWGFNIQSHRTWLPGPHDHGGCHAIHRRTWSPGLPAEKTIGCTTFGVRKQWASVLRTFGPREQQSQKGDYYNPFEPTSNYWRTQEILFEDLKLRQEIRIVSHVANDANGWGLVNVHPLMILDTSKWAQSLEDKSPYLSHFYTHINPHETAIILCYAPRIPAEINPPHGLEHCSTRLGAMVRIWSERNCIWGLIEFDLGLLFEANCFPFYSTNASEIRLYPDPVWFPLRFLESCWYHHFGWLEQHHHLQCGGSNVAAMFVSQLWIYHDHCSINVAYL